MFGIPELVFNGRTGFENMFGSFTYLGETFEVLLSSKFLKYSLSERLKYICSDIASCSELKQLSFFDILI